MNDQHKKKSEEEKKTTLTDSKNDHLKRNQEDQKDEKNDQNQRKYGLRETVPENIETSSHDGKYTSEIKVERARKSKCSLSMKKVSNEKIASSRNDNTFF